MKANNPLDEYFKKGLEGHEIKPSASVWDKIEASTESGKSGKRAGGWFFMRAAVITVLLGLSTWVFYQNQSYESPTDVIQVKEHPIAVNKGNKEQSKTSTEEETTEGEEKKEKPAPNNKKKETPKAIPVMKPPVRGGIYVSNGQSAPEIIDESQLREESAWRPETVALDVEEEGTELTPVKVKVKLKPATTPAFYANSDKEEEQHGFKEKLYAYANTQFDNLLKGKPLELPKTEKKPQLEINLGRFFNN